MLLLEFGGAGALLLGIPHGDEKSNANTKHDVEEDDLVLKPSVDLFVSLWQVHVLLLVHNGQACHDDADSQEIVQLQEKSKSSLLSLKVHCIELNEFINSMECVEDEESPIGNIVDQENMVIWVVVQVLHNLELEALGVHSHDCSQNHRDDLIGQVEGIVTSSVHPEFVKSSPNIIKSVVYNLHFYLLLSF